MALYRHLASGTTPGEVWTFSLYTNGQISLAAAQSTWEISLQTLWVGGIDSLIAPQVVLTGASTAEIDVATGNQSTRVEGALNFPGVSASPMLPFQCATAVSLRTVFATRRGRGRFFLPPLASNAIALGRLTTAAQTNIADNASVMMASLQSGGLTPVVYSRVSRAAITMTSIDVGDVIDTQRRRRNKLVEDRESRPI